MQSSRVSGLKEKFARNWKLFALSGAVLATLFLSHGLVGDRLSPGQDRKKQMEIRIREDARKKGLYKEIDTERLEKLRQTHPGGRLTFGKRPLFKA